MGLFDFWKKKIAKAEPEQVPKENKVLLAMPIFVNNKSYSLDKVTDHLKTFWGIDVTKITGNSETATFYVEGTMVILANMPLPIPQKELDDVIPYTYMWRTASEDLKNQTGHAIVSVAGDKGTPIKRYTILSKLLCSIMVGSIN